MTLLLEWSFSGVLNTVLWVVLVISMLLLIAVILLQEGKGGGLAEAFGGAGAETFGVKAHGINKFTSFVGALFLLICVLLVKFHGGKDETPLFPDNPFQMPAAQPNRPLVPPSNPDTPPGEPESATPPGDGAPSDGNK